MKLFLSELLNFSNTVTDDLFLTRLSEIDNLKLRELSLTFNGCSKNSTFGFPCLIRAQSSLEALDLTTSNSVNDYILSEIVKHMTQLKKLILKKCHNITDIGVRGIVKLRMLEVGRKIDNRRIHLYLLNSSTSKYQTVTM
jgi:hypothetical protein